jgi:hypothetical protein
MGLVFRLVELLILLVPVAGVVFAGVKAVSAVRRKQGEATADDHPGTAPHTPEAYRSARWRTIQRTVQEHDRTDTRWLDYELDVLKLLDFPVMTDMREPVTERFHRAKLRADLLRPADATVLLDDRDADHEYRSAVEEYATAFNVAEAEARRRRRSYLTEADQQRVVRGQSLLRVALDSAATPQERESAYRLACKELDGLIVLPERTQTEIERGITGELGS